MSLNRYRLRQKLAQYGLLAMVAFLAATIILFLWIRGSSPSTPGKMTPPQQVLEQFYQYEQAGDFGSSWELFHPQMKEKFKKDSYIQQRAHVFMQHFGVSTFEYQLGQATELTDWEMSPGATKLAEVIKIPATLSYYSSFGDFVIQQDVFLAVDQDQYTILWAYSKAK